MYFCILYAHAIVHVFVCTCVCVCACICVCMSIQYVYVYMCVCVNVYVYLYLYMHEFQQASDCLQCHLVGKGRGMPVTGAWNTCQRAKQ